MKTRVIYLLYRLVQALAFPALLFYFLVRVARDRRYFRSLPERLGFLPAEYKQTLAGAIWLHAVSVGEVVAAIDLIRRLREQVPRAPIFVSTTTLAGRAIAGEKLASIVDGVFYAPVDYCFAVRHVLRTLRPSVVVILETELWPNLLREAWRTGCGPLIVNGRISDGTAGRYMALRWFFRFVLAQCGCILVQSEAMRDRFIRIGAPAGSVETSGNLKHDSVPPEAPRDSPVRQFVRPGAKLWIAASTTSDGKVDEEDVVLDAFNKLPGWQLIVAPRKPDRFEAVAAKLAAAYPRYIRRSRMKTGETADLLLLDSIGELSGLFSLADVVFMGGTLADRGGHNILEPAYFGKPVIAGPHMENFRDIASDFREHNAFREIRESAELASAVLACDGDRAMGERARERAGAHAGASARAAAKIARFHAEHVPRFYRTLPARAIRWPVARVWDFVSRRNRVRKLREQKRLATPVIGVGNITAGGTGKTPFVLYLASRLRDRRPGILSRGYGRQSHHEQLALKPGDRASAGHTGDEPQMFLDSRLAYIGIGANRYAAGRLLEERFAPGVMIMDDGFQHLRLGRSVDVVLIDALDPFGDEELLPLGRLREPLDGLARADIFVITRAGLGRTVPAIERRLRDWNPRAPVFRSSTVPECWIDHAGGEQWAPADLPFSKLVAFCGLGNPDSFWCTLESIGVRTLDRFEFGDHHAYTPLEVQRLAQHAKSAGAQALLTTQKDIVNLCKEWDKIVAPLRILWLKIGVEVENEAELLAMMRGDALQQR